MSWIYVNSKRTILHKFSVEYIPMAPLRNYETLLNPTKWRYF